MNITLQIQLKPLRCRPLAMMQGLHRYVVQVMNVYVNDGECVKFH